MRKGPVGWEGAVSWPGAGGPPGTRLGKRDTCRGGTVRRRFGDTPGKTAGAQSQEGGAQAV